MLSVSDLEVSGKRVLLRLDLNVPMRGEEVTDDTRIRAVVPTVNALCAAGARVILLSHFGRPKGQRVADMSLAPIAGPLAARLGRDVVFVSECVGEMALEMANALDNGEVALMENLRFHPGEEANEAAFAGQLAALGDCYVNDAFSVCHRAHASTDRLPRLLPAAAGLALTAELKALEDALGNPARPAAALVGGAKISTKLAVLGNILGKVDALIIGGGMANTFLFARGVEVGKSLCERDMADMARDIMARADAAGCTIVLPEDVVLAREFREGAPTRVGAVGDVGADEMILDIGPKATEALIGRFRNLKTLLWNGPLGAFETAPFDVATVAAARAAAALTKAGGLLSVAGGGDTVAALALAGVVGDFSHVSTAGGAFLEWLEGRELPGIAALNAASGA